MLAQNIWGQCQAAAVRFVLVCQVLFLGVEWAEETSKWKEKVFFWRDHFRWSAIQLYICIQVFFSY